MSLALACARPVRGQSQPVQYYYDDLGRLVTVVDSAGNVATYVYDAVGKHVAQGSLFSPAAFQHLLYSISGPASGT